MDDENNTPVIGVAPSLEELVAFYDEAEGFPVIVAQEESAAVVGEKLLLDHHAIDAIAFAASTDALLENLEIMDGGDHGERTQHGDSSASPDSVSFRANSSSLLQPKSDDDQEQQQQQQRVPPAQRSQNRIERVAAQHGPKYRNRHKEELEYLRVQVSELEAQLQQLQQRSIVEHDAHAPPSSKLDDGQQERDRIRTVAPVSTAPFWKRIALHQQEATLKAEHENAQLRQTIQEQLKISKMLERILAKRHRMSSPFDALRVHENRKRIRLRSSDEPSVFQTLLKSIDERYAVLEHAYRTNADSFVNTSHEVHEARVLMDDDARGDFSIECKDAQIFPFDVDAIHKAGWQCTSSKQIKEFHGVATVLNRTVDTVSVEAAVTLRRHKMPAIDLTFRTLYKRFREQHRAMIVWESVAEWPREYTATDSDAVEIREFGWSSAETLSSSQATPSSIIKAVVEIKPELPGDGSTASVGILTELVLASYQQIMKVRFQMVEDILLGHGDSIATTG